MFTNYSYWKLFMPNLFEPNISFFTQTKRNLYILCYRQERNSLHLRSISHTGTSMMYCPWTAYTSRLSCWIWYQRDDRVWYFCFSPRFTQGRSPLTLGYYRFSVRVAIFYLRLSMTFLSHSLHDMHGHAPHINVFILRNTPPSNELPLKGSRIRHGATEIVNEEDIWPIRESY